MKYLILIFLLTVQNNLDSYKVKNRSKVEFHNCPIRTPDKKIICLLSKNNLFLVEDQKGISWYFHTKVTAINYYPINHRQHIEIKFYNKNNVLLDTFYITLWIYCNKNNKLDIIKGRLDYNVFRNYNLYHIHRVTMHIKSKMWYKCSKEML